jgi:beta-1,4-mannosyl-glycoprotein beta-1,4-N-acetylglucosaminyltransferase
MTSRKIYDVFLFNNELELLKLRLEYLFDFVDKFVVCESEQTFTGNRKPLYYLDNASEFKRYAKKIIHLPIPSCNLSDPWQIEFHQRSYFVNAKLFDSSDDLVILSDVDEIPNKARLQDYWASSSDPAILETNMYYYGLNLKMDQYCNRGGRPIIGKVGFFLSVNFGNRFRFRTKKLLPMLGTAEAPYCWHFSFFFGENWEQYVVKITSYAHTEYDIPSIKRVNRIMKRIRIGEDILARPWAWGSFVNFEKEFPPDFVTAINSLQYHRFILTRPRLLDFIDFVYVEAVWSRTVYFLSLKWKHFIIKLRSFRDRNLFK